MFDQRLTSTFPQLHFIDFILPFYRVVSDLAPPLRPALVDALLRNRAMWAGILTDADLLRAEAGKGAASAPLPAAPP